MKLNSLRPTPQVSFYNDHTTILTLPFVGHTRRSKPHIGLDILKHLDFGNNQLARKTSGIGFKLVELFCSKYKVVEL